MTATITPTTTHTTTARSVSSDSARRSALATKPLWLVGVASVVAGAVVAELISLVAKAADVPMALASSSGDAPEEIPTLGAGNLVLMVGVVGILMALAFDRWARRPARTFVVVTTVLTVASLVTPTSLVAHNATTATRLVLGLLHVVVAAVVIPPIAYRLRRS